MQHLRSMVNRITVILNTYLIYKKISKYTITHFIHAFKYDQVNSTIKYLIIFDVSMIRNVAFHLLKNRQLQEGVAPWPHWGQRKLAFHLLNNRQLVYLVHWIQHKDKKLNITCFLSLLSCHWNPVYISNRWQRRSERQTKLRPLRRTLRWRCFDRRTNLPSADSIRNTWNR